MTIESGLYDRIDALLAERKALREALMLGLLGGKVPNDLIVEQLHAATKRAEAAEAEVADQRARALAAEAERDRLGARVLAADEEITDLRGELSYVRAEIEDAREDARERDRWVE